MRATCCVRGPLHLQSHSSLSWRPLAVVLAYRLLRAVVAAPSGGCSGDYTYPLGAGHSTVPCLGVSKSPGLNVSVLPRKPPSSVPCSSAMHDFLLAIPEEGLTSFTNGEIALSSGTSDTALG